MRYPSAAGTIVDSEASLVYDNKGVAAQQASMMLMTAQKVNEAGTATRKLSRAGDVQGLGDIAPAHDTMDDPHVTASWGHCPHVHEYMVRIVCK